MSYLGIFTLCAIRCCNSNTFVCINRNVNYEKNNEYHIGLYHLTLLADLCSCPGTFVFLCSLGVVQNTRHIARFQQANVSNINSVAVACILRPSIYNFLSRVLCSTNNRLSMVS